jgi:hypothetical protein
MWQSDTKGLTGVFVKLQEVTNSFVTSACMSVCPHGTTWLTMDGFSLNLILEYFSKICPENPQVSLKSDIKSRYYTGSSVSIVTDYGLDGPGTESWWGEIFRPSRPALWPTQPPVQWVLGLSRGVESGRGRTLTPHPLLVPKSKNRVELYLYSL